MKTKFLSLILVILNLLSVTSARASHAAGGSLTYQCLGSNNYMVTFTFYRDCSGIDAPPEVTLTANSSTCGGFNFILDTIPVTGQEIINYCPSLISTCNGGSVVGIEEWVYEGQITLPAQCSDWLLYTTAASRNTVTNIPIIPGSVYFSSSTPLDNTAGNCNNTPVFNVDPVLAVCTGQNDIDLSATDPDGDSLVYSLYDPFGGQATYISGCSYSQPFTAIQPATLNTQTGLFTIYPNQTQSTVYAVQVSEYRQGVLNGTITREVACFVYPCNNIQPSLSGINGTTFYTDTFPANTASCFNLFSSDSDSTQTTKINWDAAITTGTLTGDTSFNQIGTFCWTPLLSDTAGNPHCFNVIVEDDNCPLTDSHSYNYCITVVDSGFILNTKHTSKEPISVTISPNPFHSSTLLQVSSAFEKAKLNVYNALGAIVREERIPNQKIVELNRNELHNGIYFLQLVNDRGEMISMKMIVE